MQIKEKEMKRGKRARVTGVQRFTHGLGCTVDVRRVGSYAAWLRSPEIFADSFEFRFLFILVSGCIRTCVNNRFTLPFNLLYI